MNVVIAWTAPDFCDVCAGSDRVGFRWFDGRVRGHGVTACPHSFDRLNAIPILSAPWRDDTRKQAA